jgi:acyl carrier protein
MQFTSADVDFDKVVLAIKETVYLDGRIVSSDTRLNHDLQLRPFDRIRLAMYLEETFDVEIPDDDVRRFDTVGDIANYIGRWSLGGTDVSAYTWLRA